MLVVDTGKKGENEMGGPNEVRAEFPSMTEGTKEDWEIISSHFMPFANKGSTIEKRIKIERFFKPL